MRSLAAVRSVPPRRVTKANKAPLAALLSHGLSGWPARGDHASRSDGFPEPPAHQAGLRGAAPQEPEHGQRSRAADRGMGERQILGCGCSRPAHRPERQQGADRRKKRAQRDRVSFSPKRWTSSHSFFPVLPASVGAHAQYQQEESMSAAPGPHLAPRPTGLEISKIIQSMRRAAALMAPGRALGLCGHRRPCFACVDAKLTAGPAPLAATLPGGT